MSKQIQKYLSKIRIPSKELYRPGCRHLKTTSFKIEGEAKQNDAVLSDIYKYFDEETSKQNEASKTPREPKTLPFLLESPRLLQPPPPENLCSSARFFVDTGSSSSSLIDGGSSSFTSASVTNDSLRASEETADEIAAAASDQLTAPEDFIALLTYSPSPYDDFRRSMQEMVEARLEHNGKVDWEFLEELLFCYLELNNKKSYGFILRAFVDLIVVLRENPARSPAGSTVAHGGGIVVEGGDVLMHA